MKRVKNDPDMLEEYDFSSGVRGKYAKRYAEGANVVVIDPDVAEFFPDHDAVNEALRGLAAIIKRRRKAEPAAARGCATARRCRRRSAHSIARRNARFFTPAGVPLPFPQSIHRNDGIGYSVTSSNGVEASSATRLTQDRRRHCAHSPAGSC